MKYEIAHMTAATRIALAIMVLLCVAAVAMTVSPALAHSWYPAECCTARDDCAPIASERVTEDGDGYLIDGGAFFVPHALARPSPDGGYHGCQYKNAPLALSPEYKGGKPLRCFFAPPRTT